MIKLTYIWFFLLCCCANAMTAQKKMHVITRVTEEVYVFKNKFLLEISAEKANINIVNGEPGKVKVVLKQVVKNANVKTAEEHLKAHKFAFNQERDRLFLSNYILFDELPDKLSSLFSSTYDIEVPNDCVVKIKNSLGDTRIEGVKLDLTVAIEYGKLDLNAVNGKADLNMNIGDLNIKKSNLEAKIETDNVYTRINGSGGIYVLNLNFGSLSYVLNNALTRLEAHISNTELTLVNKGNLVFDYSVKNKSGSINLLTDEKPIKEGDFEVYSSNSDASIGIIQVVSEYGDVNIY